MRLDETSYVVVDCETTGFHPNAYHRVIELALITVDASGRPQAEPWCTLLRPDRDLGPTSIHGIRGRDLEEAPTFGDVLGDVLDRLAGRVVVAHNARFDCAFLEAELERAGVFVRPLPAVCTMELANRVGIDRGRSRLRDCCRAVGIEPPGGHTAREDAEACAALLALFLPALRRAGVLGLDDLACAPPRPAEGWPRSSARAPCRARGTRCSAAEPSFIASLVDEASGPPAADTIEAISYMDVLDRALEDRRLNETEQNDLRAVAEMLGLSGGRVRSLHADYLGTLVALAYRDGVVTEREHEDLELVANALGLEGLDDALLRAATSRSVGNGSCRGSLVGKSVCFTGTLLCEYEGVPMTREVAESLAARAGLLVESSVTKRLDLLVVADPNSMSGKARKAREYGTRIVAEPSFWPMIGVDVH